MSYEKALQDLQDTLTKQERERIRKVDAILAAIETSTPENTSIRMRIRRIVAQGEYSSTSCTKIVQAVGEIRHHV